MKRLSPWLAMLLLGSAPLAAAAFDYGPNPALLADGSGAPQLPGADVHAAEHGETPGVDTLTANGSYAADTDAAVPAPAPTRPPAHRSPAPTAANKAHAPVPHAPPARTSSWQSLLPGSIQ